MAQDTPIVVLGATNLIAGYLFRRLNHANMKAEIIGRSAVPMPEGLTFTQMDITKERNWIAPDNAVVISLVPLWILVQLLPRLMGIKAIIAIGSTSVFGKANSSSAGERKTAQDLEHAEDLIRSWSEKSHVGYTILRPTLVYDGVADKNIARMARFIRRYRMLPLGAPAKGLRQPIHADDVAGAIMGAIGNPAAVNTSFNIAGGEIVTYRAMAERVFQSLGVKPRFIMLPVDWLMRGFNAAQKIGFIRGREDFGSAIFQRMNEDLVFDAAEGVRVLNYNPRRFDLPKL
jgi:nucleoside-diphosphate-sugar epimerase